MTKTFDFIVIGNNWASSLMAARLSQKGSCLRIHTKEMLGSRGASLNDSAQYMPFSDISDSCFSFLGMSAETKTVQSLTVTSGQVVPFVGFGPKKFPANDYIKAWSSSQWLKLNKNFNSWSSEFADTFSGESLVGHNVTSVTPSYAGATVRVNGEEYFSNKVFYCDEFGELIKVLPKSFVPQKAIKKVGVQSHWAMACYEFENTEAQAQTDQPHILWSEKENYNPCIGQFSETSGFTKSSWWCLFSKEYVDDVEETAKVLKFMKKQIKRAYPEFFNNLAQERVTINENFMSICEGSSQDLKSAWDHEALSVLVLGESELIPPLGTVEAAYKAIEAHL